MTKGYHLEDFRQSSLTGFNLFFKKIKNYCSSRNYECCGIATDKKLHFLENIHNNKRFFFQIPPESYFEIITKEDISFIWHSHVLGSACPSSEDLDYAKEHRHFSLIYSVVDDNFCFFDPYCFKQVYFCI
jgi:proteasome lid subunit RPN8/RPN11